MNYDLCPKCQNPQEDGWVNCPFCGREINSIVNPLEGEMETTQNAAPSRSRKDKVEIWLFRKPLVSFTIILILTIGGIGVGSLLFGNHDAKPHKPAPSKINSVPMTTDLSVSNKWMPTGYTLNPAINSKVAYKYVPLGQTSPCTWCSRTHGTNYWNIDFVSESACANFYMNSAIYSQSGALEKYWYQKLQNTPIQPQPFRAEIVTSDPTSTFKIITVTCGT